MAKTKISEYDSTANNNTDVASVNIDEGCAPSGINNAIRAVMAHLKDYQQGTNGDSFNGPHNGTVGATTPAAGTFTTLATTGNTTLGNDSGDVITINGTTTFNQSVSISSGSFNGAIGSTTPSTGAFTTLAASGAVTLSGGTANGVPYLNGSKVLTTGSALTFDGTNLANAQSTASPTGLILGNSSASTSAGTRVTFQFNGVTTGYVGNQFDGVDFNNQYATNRYHIWLNGGSEQMRLTSTGLGIGTSSFSARLAVASAVAAGSSATIAAFTGANNGTNFTINSPGATSAYIYNALQGDTALRAETGSLRIGVQSGSGVIAFGNTTSEFGRFDSSGNLGLGVTPSAWTTVTPVFQMGRASFYGFSNEARMSANFFFNGADRYIANGFATSYNQADGAHRFFTAPSGTAGNAISFTQAMTLDASGNLGVGTTYSLARLNVYANDAVPNSSSYMTNGSVFGYSLGGVGLQIGTSSNGYSWINSGYVNNSGVATPLAFFTGATERARIDSDGNLQVSNLAGTGNRAVYSTSTGILTNSSSDRSLKENDAPISQGLDAVLAMRPVSFEWVDKDKMGAQREIGFIAQEMQQIVPEVVGSNSDETLSIDYPKLVAVMAKAIQELTDRVKVLEAK